MMTYLFDFAFAKELVLVQQHFERLLVVDCYWYKLDLFVQTFVAVSDGPYKITQLHNDVRCQRGLGGSSP